MMIINGANLVLEVNGIIYIKNLNLINVKPHGDTYNGLLGTKRMNYPLSPWFNYCLPNALHYDMSKLKWTRYMTS